MMEEQAINDGQPQEPVQDIKPAFKYFPFFNRKQPVFVLVLIGIVFYCTSLYNEYALDDGIIIHQNNYVLRGVAGVKDILTKDAYDSFYRRMNAIDQLQGGRYRPLPVISYAIEQELIGTYRTGYYMFVEDLNHNGVLDFEQVDVADPGVSVQHNISTNVLHSKNDSSASEQPTQKVREVLNRYEFNDFVDLNGDQKAQMNECNNCWDTNKNFRNDPSEDLNEDGVFNEVDCQVYHADIRHFNNIWLYILACVLLYLVFVRYMFKDNPDMAFLAALIFLTHPIHSEIVANIKGRDEIFSVIFIALTFLYAFKFMDNRKTGTLVTASIMFLLALLSKEYAIVLLILIPLAMYVFNKITVDLGKLLLLGFIFLMVFVLMVVLKMELSSDISGFILIPVGALVFAGIMLVPGFKKIFLDKDFNALMIGLFTFGLIYIGMRLNAVNIAAGIPDTEILNNPYLLADGEEKIASKIFIFLKYLVLAFFPKDLSSDYSYDSIAYRNFESLDFIASLVLNLALLGLGTWLLVKRHVMGFALITYFLFLILVSNLMFDVGATMHEGFLFHASIAVAMAFAWLIISGLQKMRAASLVTRRTVLFGALTVILFLYGCKTWERNWDWKNDVTLFLKDVKTTPNSVLVLGNAGARWIDLADTKEITGINMPGQNPVFNDYNGTLNITDEELKASGYATKREVALHKGIDFLVHAIGLHPRYVNGYLNLGLASYKLNNDRDAIYYWKIAEYLYPKNPYLENYYRVYSNVLKDRGAHAFIDGQFQEAASCYNFWTLIAPNDPEAWYNLGGAYFNQGKYGAARKAWEKALQLNPEYSEVKKALEILPPFSLPPNPETGKNK